MPETDQERIARGHLLPVLALGVVTAASLWPAVEHFRTRALIDRLDGSVFTWAWWAMPRALLRGDNPFRTDQLFHPVGADVALTTTTPLISALTWPIRAALGAEAQINSVQLAAGFLAGLGAYLLAHRVTARRGPALFAGIAFMLTSHRLVHVPGHLNLIHTWVLPFGCLVFLRFVDRPSRRRALALGAFGGAAFLVDPQLALLLVVALLPLAVAHRSALRGQLGSLVLAAVLALVVASPLLAPMGWAVAHDEANPPASVDEAVLYSASPLAWILPPQDNVPLGSLVGERVPSPTDEGVVYPGVVVLGLAAAAVVLVARKRRRGWGGVALVGVILSFGPRLVVYDRVVDVPMPYALVRALPGLDVQRVPGRFALVGALGLAVLAALSLAELARRAVPRAPVVLVVLLGITTLDLFPTGLPQRDGTVPEPFEAIADDPAEGAVLEIPIQWYTGEQVIGDNSDFSFLLHAVVHQKPIVSGGASRLPDWRLDALRDVAVYREVLALQGAEGFDERADFDADDLMRLGISYVVYDRGRPAPDAFAYFTSLDLPVLADDGRVLVWQVPEAKP